LDGASTVGIDEGRTERKSPIDVEQREESRFISRVEMLQDLIAVLVQLDT
jgi:hypothetical protein